MESWILNRLLNAPALAGRQYQTRIPDPDFGARSEANRGDEAPTPAQRGKAP